VRGAVESDDEEAVPEPFAVRLPTLLLANKADRLDDPAAELEVFRELTGLRYEALVASAETGMGLEALAPWLFQRLGIVRVYTKAPGREPDRSRPFTLRQGQTIGDVAAKVHKDVAASLKFARVWGRGTFDGQQVSRDHPVCDEDVVELHTGAAQQQG
jgi:ribosome-interacting GTPase 1